MTEEEADDWEAIDVSPDENEWEEVSVPSKKKVDSRKSIPILL